MNNEGHSIKSLMDMEIDKGFCPHSGHGRGLDSGCRVAGYLISDRGLRRCTVREWETCPLLKGLWYGLEKK